MKSMFSYFRCFSLLTNDRHLAFIFDVFTIYMQCRKLVGVQKWLLKRLRNTGLRERQSKWSVRPLTPTVPANVPWVGAFRPPSCQEPILTQAWPGVAVMESWRSEPTTLSQPQWLQEPLGAASHPPTPLTSPLPSSLPPDPESVEGQSAQAKVQLISCHRERAPFNPRGAKPPAQAPLQLVW